MTERASIPDPSGRDRSDPIGYTGVLRPREQWWIWQVSFTARVDGIRGGVDLDVMAAGAKP